MRKRWKKLCAVGASLILTMSMLTGCGGGGKSSTSGEKVELNIMVWDQDYDESVFKAFEEQTGIHVNIGYIDNTDTILSKLVQGSESYDLLDMESAYIKSFVDNGLLAEIDHSKIENEKYIKKEYYKGYTGDEDLKYTVPVVGPIYTCVLYNKETCPIEIKSFADLADPALKNQVCMVNSTISLFGMALQSLGYSADSTDEKEIAEAADLLTDIKGNVKAFVGESAIPNLENGECSVAYCWDYMNLCNASKDNWDKYAVAEIPGGAECSCPYLAIPSSSKHVEEAEMLINFLLDPEQYAVSINAFGALPILEEDCLKPYLKDGFYDNPAIAVDEKLYDESWKIAVNDDQISLLDTYYTKLMSGN